MLAAEGILIRSPRTDDKANHCVVDILFRGISLVGVVRHLKKIHGNRGYDGVEGIFVLRW